MYEITHQITHKIHEGRAFYMWTFFSCNSREHLWCLHSAKLYDDVFALCDLLDPANEFIVEYHSGNDLIYTFGIETV